MPRRSWTSVRVRSLDREAALAALRALAVRLGGERPEIAEIRLFGSLARGTRNPYADADVLVVIDATDVPFRDRLPRYKPLGSPVPMDLTVCTREELERELADGNRFVTRMVEESIVLYAREPAIP
jgi:predicted nucleotidyltransferase